jgi:hypothetical protein
MNKTIYCIYLLLFTLISCQNKEGKIGGLYFLENHQTFYAIELNETQNSVKIFLQSLYYKKNFKTYINAKYELKDDELIINMIESDLLPSQRKNQIICKVKSNTIKINCEELFNETIRLGEKCLETELLFIRK